MAAVHRGISYREPYRKKKKKNAELNPTCHLLPLLGAHHILHVSGIRVKYSFNFESCNLEIIGHEQYHSFDTYTTIHV
jgi:hypothetical protein